MGESLPVPSQALYSPAPPEEGTGREEVGRDPRDQPTGFLELSLAQGEEFALGLLLLLQADSFCPGQENWG
jgi:hypothetical protein